MNGDDNIPGPIGDENPEPFDGVDQSGIYPWWFESGDLNGRCVVIGYYYGEPVLSIRHKDQRPPIPDEPGDGVPDIPLGGGLPRKGVIWLN